MTDFDVGHPVPAESISPEQRASAMGFTSAHQWTCSDVLSRLCVRGFTQMIKDLDTTSASTPVLLSLQLLLTLALAFDRWIYTLDICIAVLHATLNPSDGPIYVWPPEEYLPHKNVPWNTSCLWLKHSTKGMTGTVCFRSCSCGFQRSHADGHVDFHEALQVILLVCVGDLIFSIMPKRLSRFRSFGTVNGFSKRDRRS